MSQSLLFQLLIIVDFGFGFNQITRHTCVYVVRVLVSKNHASHLRSGGRGFDARSARACVMILGNPCVLVTKQYNLVSVSRR